MKKLIALFLFSVIVLEGSAQKKLEYRFDQARVLLAQRKIESAIKELRKIYITEPRNANINFLMGAAYTELPGTQKKAMFHLKRAVQNVNVDYKTGEFKEKGAPIHVYYYLAVALVELDKCAEADKAFTEFKKYKSKVDPYYIDEVDRHMQKCPFSKEEKTIAWKKEVPVPEGYDPTFIAPEPTLEVDSSILISKGLVTERLEYTTSAPLYGVQIGSNMNPSPTSSYSAVKNVDVFIDNEGKIRYVVGHFSYREQAERLLESIQEKGYKDAFVVNVNDKRKYANEVISYKNINLRSGITGTIEYYVQLGAFQDTIPKKMLDLYFKVDGIKEYKRNENTVLAIGTFDNYKDALQQKNKVNAIGVNDAFIVAYNRGKKIPLNEAINHTDQKFKAVEEN